MIKLTFYTFVYNLKGGSKLFETHIGKKQGASQSLAAFVWLVFHMFYAKIYEI